VGVVVGVFPVASTSQHSAGRLKQLNSNRQAQSVCSWYEISDVINFPLELVMAPRRLSLVVVVSRACTLTTTSMLPVMQCVLVQFMDC